MPDLQHLQPNVKKALDKALAAAKEQGLSPVIVSGYRSPEKNAAMQRRYDAGDREGMIARPATHSQHSAGMALDISEKGGRNAELADIMKQHGFAWAGAKDRNHFTFGKGAAPGEEMQFTRRTQATSEPEFVRKTQSDAKVRKDIAQQIVDTGEEVKMSAKGKPLQVQINGKKIPVVPPEFKRNSGPSQEPMSREDALRDAQRVMAETEAEQRATEERNVAEIGARSNARLRPPTAQEKREAEAMGKNPNAFHPENVILSVVDRLSSPLYAIPRAPFNRFAQEWSKQHPHTGNSLYDSAAPVAIALVKTLVNAPHDMGAALWNGYVHGKVTDPEMWQTIYKHASPDMKQFIDSHGGPVVFDAAQDFATTWGFFSKVAPLLGRAAKAGVQTLGEDTAVGRAATIRMNELVNKFEASLPETVQNYAKRYKTYGDLRQQLIKTSAHFQHYNQDLAKWRDEFEQVARSYRQPIGPLGRVLDKAGLTVENFGETMSDYANGLAAKLPKNSVADSFGAGLKETLHEAGRGARQGFGATGRMLQNVAPRDNPLRYAAQGTTGNALENYAQRFIRAGEPLSAIDRAKMELDYKLRVKGPSEPGSPAANAYDAWKAKQAEYETAASKLSADVNKGHSFGPPNPFRPTVSAAGKAKVAAVEAKLFDAERAEAEARPAQDMFRRRNHDVNDLSNQIGALRKAGQPVPPELEAQWIQAQNERQFAYQKLLEWQKKRDVLTDLRAEHAKVTDQAGRARYGVDTPAETTAQVRGPGYDAARQDADRLRQEADNAWNEWHKLRQDEQRGINVVPQDKERIAAARKAILDEAQANGINPKHITDAAEHINATFDQTAKELVDLGVLNPKAVELLKGSYLPRHYAIYSRDPADVYSFLADLEDQTQSLRDQGLLKPDESLVNADLMKRANPTLRPNPRGIGGNKQYNPVISRKDLSQDQMQHLGLSQSVSGPFASGVDRQVRLATRAQFARTIAENPEWFSKTPREGWVPVGGGQATFELKGGYLHPDVADFLQELDNPYGSLQSFVSSPAGKRVQDATRFFKRVWVSQPKTQLNNIMGNYQLAAGSAGARGIDFSPQKLVADDRELEDAMHRGVDTPWMAELRKNSNILDPSSTQLQSRSGGFGSKLGVRNLGDTIKESLTLNPGAEGNVINRATNKFGDFFQQRELGAKYSLYKTFRESGYDEVTAAKLVQDALFDYTDVGSLRRLGELGATPFITFPSKAIKRYVAMAIQRPDMFSYFSGRTPQRLLDRYADLQDGQHGDTQKRRDLGLLGPFDFVNPLHYNPLQTPFGTVQGPKYMSGQTLAPLIQGLPGAEDNFEDPEKVAARRMFPLLTPPLFGAMNVNPLSGKPIVTPGEPPALNNLDWMQHGHHDNFNYYLQSYFPQARDVMRVTAAMQGRTPYASIFSRPQSLGGAVLQAFTGISTRQGIGETSYDAGTRRIENAAGEQAQSQLKMATDYWNLRYSNPSWRPLYNYDQWLATQPWANDRIALKQHWTAARDWLSKTIGGTQYNDPKQAEEEITRASDYIFALFSRLSTVTHGEEDLLNNTVPTPDNVTAPLP